jgi:hypothetical protein
VNAAGVPVCVRVPPQYFAVVNSDGTLARGSQGVTSNGGGGNVIVVTPRDVTNCAYVATVGLTGSTSTASDGTATVVGRSDDATAVYVSTYSQSGASAAEAFHLIILCP